MLLRVYQAVTGSGPQLLWRELQDPTSPGLWPFIPGSECGNKSSTAARSSGALFASFLLFLAAFLVGFTGSKPDPR